MEKWQEGAGFLIQYSLCMLPLSGYEVGHMELTEDDKLPLVLYIHEMIMILCKIFVIIFTVIMGIGEIK